MSKSKVRCKTCYGSGKVMGGGMMQHDCDECDGTGKIVFIEDDIKELERLKAKEEESRQKAINEIKELDPNMSDEKAKEIFEEEFKKLEDEDKKLKRKK